MNNTLNIAQGQLRSGSQYDIVQTSNMALISKSNSIDDLLLWKLILKLLDNQIQRIIGHLNFIVTTYMLT